MKGDLLQVLDLHTSFFTEGGELKAVRGVTFSVREGEALGIVGESGCGKSVTALSIMRLVPDPGRIVKGKVIFRDKDLLELPEEEMRRIRGREIAMVFQEPMTSLNPVFTIGSQIAEAIETHHRLERKEIKKRVIEALARVGIPSPERRYNDYPHQLSGGMRQRVMIAMALACKPSLLIADEPTTALDVTIQAQILDLLLHLREEFGMSMILITHDLGIVAETVQKVLVMYAGEVVEYGRVEDIFTDPLHPYTVGLLKAIPSIESRKGLEPIPGTLPDLKKPIKGCAFKERCLERVARCEEDPDLKEVTRGHWVRCWRRCG